MKDGDGNVYVYVKAVGSVDIISYFVLKLIVLFWFSISRCNNDEIVEFEAN